MSEEQQPIKCDYNCDQPALMQIKNLKNNVAKNMCQAHFGEFITQGQSRVYEQFVRAMNERNI